jgi:anti-sigma B factor antagonist
MQVSEQQRANATVLAVRGRLDVHTAGLLKEHWTNREAGNYFIIDFSETEFIDSVGLAVLVSGLKVARASGHDLLLVNPNEAISIILNLTAMIRVFRIYATVEEALAALEIS